MRKWERALLYVGLAVGGLLFVHLSRQFEALSSNYTQLRERLQWPHAGYSVPTFTAETLDGDPVTVGKTEEGRRQLLLVFDTECRFCRASLPAWREITAVARLEAADVDVLGVAVDEDGPVGEYRAEHRLEFPVLTFPEPKLQRLYRARNVPLIALLDSEGRVLYSRPGALEDPAAIDSVMAALRTRPEPAPVTDAVANGG
jgi:peroxiredoxin